MQSFPIFYVRNFLVNPNNLVSCDTAPESQPRHHFICCAVVLCQLYLNSWPSQLCVGAHVKIKQAAPVTKIPVQTASIHGSDTLQAPARSYSQIHTTTISGNILVSGVYLFKSNECFFSWQRILLSHIGCLENLNVVTLFLDVFLLLTLHLFIVFLFAIFV